jgi:hypothetical protein
MPANGYEVKGKTGGKKSGRSSGEDEEQPVWRSPSEEEET